MNILLLNEYFPPDTSATAKIAAVVADTLSKRHQVTVLAGRPSYDPDERYPFAFLRRRVAGNLTVECVGSTTYPRHQMRRRVANYLSYAALAVPRAMFIKADLVLAMTDPPFNGIVGAMIARMKGIPFVYNIRDLYPDMALGGDIVRPRSWVALWERLHRAALRRAARVIVLGDDMRDRILAKGVDPERVVVVRDGTSLPAAPAPLDHPAIGEIRGAADFVVLHAGNLGFYGAWDTLLAASKLLPVNGTRMIFVGMEPIARASRNRAAAPQRCVFCRFGRPKKYRASWLREMSTSSRYAVVLAVSLYRASSIRFSPQAVQSSRLPRKILMLHELCARRIVAWLPTPTNRPRSLRPSGRSRATPRGSEPWASEHIRQRKTMLE